MGLLLLWLGIDCKGSKDTHKAEMNKWKVHPNLRLLERRALRREVHDSVPDMRLCFNEERPARDEELGGEPLGLCGL